LGRNAFWSTAPALPTVKTVSRDKKTGEIRPCGADRFNRIIQINLVGTFRIAKSAAGMLALAPLADGDRGAVVNTASAAAPDGQVGQASYAASKAAVMGMPCRSRAT
jgi:NAD(P)-dependent dehydrogenase (short-subunit alcohol dehydrogenase family)